MTVKRCATVRVLADRTVTDRVRMLTQVLGELAQEAMDDAWSDAGIDALCRPVSALPVWGYRAWQRAYGTLPEHPGMHLDSRARWMAAEIAARCVRQRHHERRLVEGLLRDGLDTWPRGYTSVEVRNARRALRRHAREHDGVLPIGFFALRPEPPRAPAHMAPLACTDKQFAEWIDIDPDREIARLRVKLPTIATPTSRAHWSWETITVPLPASTIAALAAGGKLARPTLRISRDRVLADLVTDTQPPPLPEGPTRVVLGVDWGERRLLTGTDAWVGTSGEHRVSGRPVFFDAKGMQAKLTGLRRQAGLLRSKRDRIQALLDGRPDQPVLQERVTVLETELERIWDRYHHGARALAHAAARWTVEHAKAQGADTIAHEDLATLEARFRNRKGINARVNHQVRGLVFTALEHKAQMAGIRIQTVPAKDTSSTCGRCLARNRHQKAPNDRRQGRGWAICRGCDRSGDRDLTAAEHIALRALPDPPGPRRVRQCSRPTLTSSSHAPRASRVKPGRAVRPGGTPRAIDSLSRWPQRPFAVSPEVHRAPLGMIHGYQDRVRLTPTRPIATNRKPRN